MENEHKDKSDKKAIAIATLFIVCLILAVVTLVLAAINVGIGNAFLFLCILVTIYGFNYEASRQHNVPLYGVIVSVIVTVIALYLVIRAAYFDEIL